MSLKENRRKVVAGGCFKPQMFFSFQTAQSMRELLIFVILLLCWQQNAASGSRLRTELFSKLTTTSGCSPYGVGGWCGGDLFDGNLLKNAMCNGDKLSCDFYKYFFDPLLIVISKLNGPPPALCFGDFNKDYVEDSDEMEAIGCTAIPWGEGTKFGMMGASLPLSPVVQGLVGFTPPKEETIYPNFCMGFREGGINNCGGGLTFGISMNADTIETIAELTSNPIIKLCADLVDAGLQQAAFGFSTDAKFGVEVSLFTEEDWLHKEPVPAHFFWQVTAEIDVPSIPEPLEISGTVREFFEFGTNAFGIIDDLVNGNVNAKSFVAGFSRGIIVSGDITFPFAEWTRKLLDDVTLNLFEATMYVSAAVGSVTYPTLKPGIYASFSSGAVGNIVDIASHFCSFFSGITRALNVPSCPSFSANSGKLGLYVNTDGLGLGFSMPGFHADCRVRGRLPQQHLKMRCRIENKFFEVLEDAAGFVVKQLTDLWDDHGEIVQEISLQAVEQFKGFGKATYVTSLDQGRAAGARSKAVLRGARRFFGGRGGGSHQDKGHGFINRYRCEEGGTWVRLFDSDQSEFDSWFNKYRQPGTGECYTQCNLYVKKHNWAAANCCMYVDYGNHRGRCELSERGRTSCNASNKSVNNMFKTDFDQQALALQDGQQCTSDRSCISGLCHDGECKQACDEANPCDYSEITYCTNSNQCESNYCIHNQCQPDSDVYSVSFNDDAVHNQLFPVNLIHFRPSNGRFQLLVRKQLPQMGCRAYGSFVSHNRIDDTGAFPVGDYNRDVYCTPGTVLVDFRKTSDGYFRILCKPLQGCSMSGGGYWGDPAGENQWASCRERDHVVYALRCHGANCETRSLKCRAAVAGSRQFTGSYFDNDSIHNSAFPMNEWYYSSSQQKWLIGRSARLAEMRCSVFGPFISHNRIDDTGAFAVGNSNRDVYCAAGTVLVDFRKTSDGYFRILCREMDGCGTGTSGGYWTPAAPANSWARCQPDEIAYAVRCNGANCETRSLKCRKAYTV